MKSRHAVLPCGDRGQREAGVSDNWLTDALHRVDKRCARRGAEREAPAGPFSAIYWLLFWVVALGVPAGLWHFSADVTGLIGVLWQGLAG